MIFGSGHLKKKIACKMQFHLKKTSNAIKDYAVISRIKHTESHFWLKDAKDFAVYFIMCQKNK